MPVTPTGPRRRKPPIDLLLGVLVAVWLAVPALTLAQQAPVSQDADATDAAQEPAILLSAEELDTLVAPVALYPDPLLAQVLVAATYPLEVVKAARWVAQNETLADDARVEAADAEGWDPSVAVLAAAFPSVVERMADDLDTTEALGDALLTDSEAVLDAVQRQRARAAAVGNLENNAAQTVTVEGDTITIAPADPQVVYVPAYNPATAYTQPAAAPPVVVTDPDDTDYDSGDLLATGVIAFGAGLLVGEMFDDDDDWGGYWGAPAFGWGSGAVYPRPGRGGVYVDGDVNISRDNDRVRVDRGDAWQPEQRRAEEARERTAARSGAPRDTTRSATRERDAARDNVRARAESGTRPDRPAAGGQGRDPTREAARPAARDGSGAAGRGDAASGTRATTGRPAASGARERPAAATRPAASRPTAGAATRPAPAAKARPAPARQSAFDRGADRGGAHASAASNRGARSAGGGGRSGGGGGRSGGGGGGRGR